MTFSRLNLVFRNLRHFRAANLAILAGMAVATAVLTGALLVGDSVRGSLRDLAVRRLGAIDHAMISPRLFPQSLADRIVASPAYKQSNFIQVVPALSLRGSAATQDGKERSPGVQITGIDGRGFDPLGLGLKLGADQAMINTELADSLENAGGPLRFSIVSPESAPRDATLVRRARNEAIATLEAAKSSVTPAGGFLDLFNLAGGQRAQRAAWVNLRNLQDRLDRPGQVNLLFASDREGASRPEDAARLNEIVRSVATPGDFGLSTVKSKDESQVSIVSDATFLHPEIVRAASQLAAEQKIPLTQVSAYLINHVIKVVPPVREHGERREYKDRELSSVHYAIAAGINEINGRRLNRDEVVVNQWTADQMELKTGDLLRLDYYQRQRTGELAQVSSNRGPLRLYLKVVKIIPMTGLGADPTLTPEYKGLTDAESIAKWNPPAGVNIDKKLVTKADEKYWDQHRAAPKLFVNLETAAYLWGTAYGDLTSLRVPADNSKAFLAELPHRIDPAPLGLVFRPIKAQQIAAASGGTDFGQLFAGFSIFLLVSAVVLVAMLFRLSVEQRARQLGLLAATGLAPSKARNLCLAEGFFLALAGGLLGLVAAIGYTAFMIHGLRTWWVGAIGTSALALHVHPLTLAIGLAAGIAVAMLAVLWGARKIARTQPAMLLAGGLGTQEWRLPRRARATGSLAVFLILGAGALFTLSALNRLRIEIGFLVGGALLLVAMLTIAFARLRPRHRVIHNFSMADLAIKNATRNRARSILCVALIALASFIIVTVSAMQSSTPRNTFDKKSGSGGYALIVQTDIPLMADLNTPEARKLLMRQSAAEDPRWKEASFIMMRRWAGQDISCLNITRPDSPTILSVPPALAKQDRFNVASQLTPGTNTMALLDLETGDPNVIPVIADDETAKWILKVRLGDMIPIVDAAGHPRKLKLIATLKDSIFQSELLISEANFLDLFPSTSGFSVILVETAPEDVTQTWQLLNQTLNNTDNQETEDYSALIETTASRLDAYHKVANTYLSTFQVLGSLGLMLGTIGLAVVLLRNLVERRAELALMASLGIGPAQRARLVFLENLGLLLTGLFIGAGAAVAGVIPMTRLSAHRVNVPALSLALAAVLVAGIVSLAVAVRFAGRRVTPAALRAE